MLILILSDININEKYALVFELFYFKETKYHILPAKIVNYVF